jgi:hypothetical protein
LSGIRDIDTAHAQPGNAASSFLASKHRILVGGTTA